MTPRRVLLAVLRHPLFVTVISVVLASGLLKSWELDRTQREYTRREALRLIDNFSVKMSNVIAKVYRHIREDICPVELELSQSMGGLHAAQLMVETRDAPRKMSRFAIDLSEIIQSTECLTDYLRHYCETKEFKSRLDTWCSSPTERATEWSILPTKVERFSEARNYQMTWAYLLVSRTHHVLQEATERAMAP